MVQYPIQIKRDSYRGSNLKKQAMVKAKNQSVSKLEIYINEMLKNQQEPIRIYTFHEIALQTGLELELVRLLGSGIDGGQNGFTASKVDLTVN